VKNLDGRTTQLEDWPQGGLSAPNHWVTQYRVKVHTSGSYLVSGTAIILGDQLWPENKSNDWNWSEITQLVGFIDKNIESYYNYNSYVQEARRMVEYIEQKCTRYKKG
jgi:hypothetical protein